MMEETADQNDYDENGERFKARRYTWRRLLQLDSRREIFC